MKTKHTPVVLLWITVVILGITTVNLNSQVTKLEDEKVELIGRVAASKQMVADTVFVARGINAVRSSQTEEIAAIKSVDPLKVAQSDDKQTLDQQEVAEMPKMKSKGEISATVSAYNTVKGQCPYPYNINALGKVAKIGTVAASPDLFKSGAVKFGDRVHIDGVGFLVVEDKTADHIQKRFDICFEKDVEGAKNFGLQRKKVKVFSVAAAI